MLLAFPIVALADDDPPAPAVTTQPATNIGETRALLNAQVVTNGAPTTGHFVYGTAPDRLDRRTPDLDLGSAGTVSLLAELTDVTANTTYYFAVVAENDDWVVAGDVLSFQTQAVAEILGSAVDDITYRSATLHLHVDTHGLAGVTVSGAVGTARVTTPARGVGLLGVAAWFGPLPVPGNGDIAIPLTRLAAGKTYYWTARPDGYILRALVTGEFHTDALIAMARPNLSAAKVAYGSHVTISGTVPKPGILVTLAEQAPIYAGPVATTPVTAIADGVGVYAFEVRAEQSARYGVAIAGAAPLTAAGLARLDVFPAVTVRLKRAPHHRFRVTGSYAPDIAARVSLFRRGGGRVGAAVKSNGAFRFAARTLKPGTYEVRVTPDSRPELIAGKSAAFTVPRR